MQNVTYYNPGSTALKHVHLIMGESLLLALMIFRQAGKLNLQLNRFTSLWKANVLTHKDGIGVVISWISSWCNTANLAQVDICDNCGIKEEGKRLPRLTTLLLYPWKLWLAVNEPDGHACRVECSAWSLCRLTRPSHYFINSYLFATKLALLALRRWNSVR